MPNTLRGVIPALLALSQLLQLQYLTTKVSFRQNPLGPIAIISTLVFDNGSTFPPNTVRCAMPFLLAMIYCLIRQFKKKSLCQYKDTAIQSAGFTFFFKKCVYPRYPFNGRIRKAAYFVLVAILSNLLYIRILAQEFIFSLIYGQKKNNPIF